MNEQTENTPTNENSTNLSNGQSSSGLASLPEMIPIQTKPQTPLDGVAMQNAPSKYSQIKKYFFYIMIGGLIVSAAISIIATLVGQYNNFLQKSLFTTLSIVIHSLIALDFVSININHRNKVDDTIFNTLFGIVIASFVTSILALWQVITGPIIGHLYLLYLYALIAAGLCYVLWQTNRIDNKTRNLANASIYITIFLFFLLIPSVFVDVPSLLPDIYYRGIGAAAILLGTTSVLTAIFHRLYTNKHPGLHADEAIKKHYFTSIKIFALIILLLFIVFFAAMLLIRLYSLYSY